MSVKVSITECHAGAEPKIFDGEKGSKVARLDVAHNERTEGPGTVKEETRWFQAVAFGPAAKFIQDHVHKGSRLTIADAELHYGRAYTGKDGVERTPDELHIIPGRGKIELKQAAGERADRKAEAQPAA